MKTTLLTALLCLFTISLGAQTSSSPDLAKRVYDGGEYLHLAGNNLTWGLGLGLVGTSASVLTSAFGEGNTTPIVLGAVTATLTISFSISAIVNINRSAKAFKGYSTFTPVRDINNNWNPPPASTPKPKQKTEWFGR
jgi:hypothetical protein